MNRYDGNYFWFHYRAAEVTFPQPVLYMGDTMAKRFMLEMVLRNYSDNYLRSLILAQLTDDPTPNIIAFLELLAQARSSDEALSSFDWFSMHDRCQKFFDDLRQTYMNNYIAFQSELLFPPRQHTQVLLHVKCMAVY